MLADFVHFDTVTREPCGDGFPPFQIAAAGGVDGDAVGFAEAGDGFLGAMDGWVGDDLDAAPAAAIGVEDAIEVEADGPPPLFDSVASSLVQVRGAVRQDAVDCFIPFEPGPVGVRLVVPDPCVMRPRVMAAEEAEPIAIVVPARRARKISGAWLRPRR